MIDIHCHILPGVDDGPGKIDESLKMARKAVDEGIKTIIATPHHKNNKYENVKGSILQNVESFNKQLINEDIPLTIFPGQEIRIYGEILEDYQKGEILPLNMSKFIFIEFPTASVPKYSERMLYNLQLEGFTPIIVHPERNKEIIENPKQLYNFVKNGILTQVTAASITGHFGKSIKKFSEQLILHNLTHFVASDAHNTHNRSFKMIEAHDYIEENFGIEYVYLFKENSQKIIDNGDIYQEIPEPIQRRKFLGIF